jgi:hypothetical protein
MRSSGKVQQDLRRWHRWYAWHPVHINAGNMWIWVWGETIERKMNPHPHYDGYSWERRLINGNDARRKYQN